MSTKDKNVMSLLDIVKIRVGISSNVRDDFISTLIDATKHQLEKTNGIILDDDNIHHSMFLADFVSWRYDNQGNDSMPAYLRLQFNDLWNTQKESDSNEL